MTPSSYQDAEPILAIELARTSLGRYVALFLANNGQAEALDIELHPIDDETPAVGRGFRLAELPPDDVASIFEGDLERLDPAAVRVQATFKDPSGRTYTPVLGIVRGPVIDPPG